MLAHNETNDLSGIETSNGRERNRNAKMIFNPYFKCCAQFSCHDHFKFKFDFR